MYIMHRVYIQAMGRLGTRSREDCTPLRHMTQRHKTKQHMSLSHNNATPSRQKTIRTQRHHKRQKTITTQRHHDTTSSQHYAITTLRHYNTMPSRHYAITTTLHHIEKFNIKTLATQRHHNITPPIPFLLLF